MVGGETVTAYFAFLAGLASFLSPCVLPLVPAYIFYLTGNTVAQYEDVESSPSRWTLILNSLFFILGFSLVFISLGASASFLGKFLSSHQELFRKVSGIIIVLFGLQIAGLLKIQALFKETRLHIQPKAAGPGSSFLLGIAFSAGWTPCVGPILGTILFYASMSESVFLGIYLLTIYSLGLAIPFLITAVAISSFNHFLRAIAPYFRYISLASGGMLVLFGVLIYTNQLAKLNQYSQFLNNFLKFSL